MMPNWRDPQHYQFCQSLTAEQWAWELLRRNPVYQREWQDFIDTWRLLEATYGKPSQRDVTVWKRDPRAWVTAEACPDSECRVDGDKVLIECALGARWGFYKFPPDPQDNDPVRGGRLVWRELSIDTPLLEALQAAPAEIQQVAVVFDLGIPLAPQLDQAKRRLQIEQRKQIASGDILPPRIIDHAKRLTLGLRLLDAVGDDIPLTDLAVAMEVTKEEAEFAMSETLKLRDRDYRRLLLLR